MDLIETLKETTGDTPYVFANPKTSKPYADLQKADARVKKISEINDFTKHVLRRTMSTNMGRLNMYQDTIDRIQDHSIMSRNRMGFI